MARWNDVQGALTVPCPTCERQAGYPCQKLTGARMLDEPAVAPGGGLIGLARKDAPHDERINAWRNRPR